VFIFSLNFVAGGFEIFFSFEFSAQVKSLNEPTRLFVENEFSFQFSFTGSQTVFEINSRTNRVRNRVA
jgi:hypothetical protein